MKKSFKKHTARNGNVVTTWERRLKAPAGEKRPWFHVYAESNGVKGLHSFFTKADCLAFFNRACKMAESNNFVISAKAQENLKQYASWSRAKVVPVVREF